MAKIWEAQDISIYKQWVEMIIDVQDTLNDWEMSFIANIELRLDKGYNLTELQAQKLESIYVNKTK